METPLNVTTSGLNVLGDRLMADVGFACSMLMCGFLLLGVGFNSVAFYVFTRPHFRTTSINVLLAALAVSDNVLLVLAVPVSVVDPLCVWLQRPPTDEFVSFLICAFPLVLMAQCCTIWLLVVVTIERWIVVCRPLLARQYLSRSRALVSIVMVVLTSMAYNMIRFWEFKTSYSYVTGSLVVTADLRANPVYMLWYANVLSAFTMFLVPLSILSLLGYKVARQTSASHQVRIRLTKQQCSEYKTARMMFNIVIVFVCCYGASFVLEIVDTVNDEFAASRVGTLFNNINNVLLSFNSACNCMFYWHYCSRFRRELNARRLERYVSLMMRRQTDDVTELDVMSVPMKRRSVSTAALVEPTASDRPHRKCHSTTQMIVRHSPLLSAGVHIGEAESSSEVDTDDANALRLATSTVTIC